jgi:hypothetical protein
MPFKEGKCLLKSNPLFIPVSKPVISRMINHGEPPLTTVNRQHYDPFDPTFMKRISNSGNWEDTLLASEDSLR